ncbi:MAG TPA: sialidase family protein, partial [Chitinophagaceae bacterium]|nr:sialidase family protein [Chitinophagaceae bacterium]
MDTRTNDSCSLQRVAALLVCMIVLNINTVFSQITSGTDRNTSLKTGSQNECAIAKNPTNVLQLFTACNNNGPGLYAARSTDGGLTWIYPDPADKTIADGDANQGPAAFCDPTLAWDEFGNLFIAYISAAASDIVVILSTDGGATFTNVTTFGPASVDQPTITAAAGQVWVIWNQAGSMVARGAAVTGLGTVGAFNALQNIPGTSSCSFGDIAISPGGAVCQVCQTLTNEGPGTIRANIDADGLGAGNFGASIVVTTTNVGAFDGIPAQNTREIDAEAGLAYDRNLDSDHPGRLYIVYTDEVTDESNNTDIMLRFSDDDGGTWSAAQRVNDDPAAPVRSQFLPRIASNPISGNVGITWFDCRNSAANNTIQIFATLATPTGASPTFLPNQPISDGTSNGNGDASMQYGDYNGMAYFQGIIHPVWPDNS